MNKKNVFWIIVLLLAAAAIIVNALDIIPKISLLTIVLAVVLAYILIQGTVELNWYKIFIPIALLLSLFADRIGNDIVDKLTPGPAILASVLLAIAFSMIFKKKHKEPSVTIGFNGEQAAKAAEGARVENYEDGEIVNVKNSFGAVNKYVNTDSFRQAYVNNSMGAVNMYLDNAILARGGAKIDINNSFGAVNLYIPATWNTIVYSEASFGTVKDYREENHADPSMPEVHINAESNFGEITIHYN